jgi:hypothetical protein
VYLHGSGASTTQGWTATYDVTGADVLQVIDWAQRQAGTSLTFAVALVWDDKSLEASHPGRERGLVWLVGMDGNDEGVDVRENDAQERMLSRRREPVDIPRRDRMPSSTPSIGPDLISRLNRQHPPG